LLFNGLLLAGAKEVGMIFLSLPKLPDKPPEIGMSTHGPQSLFLIDWPRFSMVCAVSLEWLSVQQLLAVISI
jgi:hypothetical protein